MKRNIFSGPVAVPAVRPFLDTIAGQDQARNFSPRGLLARTMGLHYHQATDGGPADPGEYKPTTTKAPAEMTADERSIEAANGVAHMVKSQAHDSHKLTEFQKATEDTLKELKTASEKQAGDLEALEKKALAMQRQGILGLGQDEVLTAEMQLRQTADFLAKRHPKACEAVGLAFAGTTGKGWGFGQVELTPDGGMILKTDSTTGASGAAVLNPELTLDIYDLLLSYGAFRELDVRRMGTKQQRLIIKNGRPTAYWVKEGQEYPESGINLGQQILTAGKIGVIDGFTREFLDDSPINLGAMILADFAEAIAYRMDYSAFLGDGTDDTINGTMVGICNAATVVNAGAGGTTVAAMKYDDVLAVVTGSPQAILNRAPRWFMNPLMLGSMLGIKDGNGRPIFQNALNPVTYGAMGDVLGFPVTLTNVLPFDNSAGKIVGIFGDPKAYAIGLRQDLAFAFSDEVRFTSNQRVYRADMRGCGAIRNPLALRVLKTAAA